MKIGIIGCGNMGCALLQGIIARGWACGRDILISDRDRKKLRLAQLKFKVGATLINSQLFKKCDVIILAIKPQNLEKLLQGGALPLKGKLLISICAGISTKKLEGYLGRVSIVRVMPNMPAQISQGISALSLGRYATLKDKRLAISIFSCLGEVVEVKEQLMDAVTAISGSGPAYLFYFVEKLIAAGERLGISSAIAEKLARKTVLGSAALIDQSLKKKAREQILRKRVTSKGGTTEAALKVLKKKAFGNILQQACFAAAKRSKQLRK